MQTRRTVFLFFEVLQKDCKDHEFPVLNWILWTSRQRISATFLFSIPRHDPRMKSCWQILKSHIYRTPGYWKSPLQKPVNHPIQQVDWYIIAKESFSSTMHHVSLFRFPQDRCGHWTRLRTSSAVSARARVPTSSGLSRGRVSRTSWGLWGNT